jgi:hypothetical protein
MKTQRYRTRKKVLKIDGGLTTMETSLEAVEPEVKAQGPLSPSHEGVGKSPLYKHVEHPYLISER